MSTSTNGGKDDPPNKSEKDPVNEVIAIAQLVDRAFSGDVGNEFAQMVFRAIIQIKYGPDILP